MYQTTLSQNKAVIATQKMKDFMSDILSVDVIYPDTLDKEQPSIYKSIWSQRTKYYKAKAPHLLDINERKMESDLDQRGIIFSVSSSTQLLASLRLVKRPFEIEQYQTNELNLNQYNNYWEIGRLVTCPDLDQVTLAIIVQYLLCISGLEIFTLLGCEGLIGICKPTTYKFFSKFGMNIIGTAHSSRRNITYHVIKGDISHVLLATEKIIFNQMKIHKRLSYALA